METKNVFRMWIDSIPVGDYGHIRMRVIRDCRISAQIFRHWKAGTVKVPPLAQEKINEIAQKEIFKIEKE